MQEFDGKIYWQKVKQRKHMLTIRENGEKHFLIKSTCSYRAFLIKMKKVNKNVVKI